MDHPKQESASDAPLGTHTASKSEALFAMKLITAGLGGVVIWFMIWLMLENAARPGDSTWRFVIPTLFVSVMTLLVYRENRKWWKPSRQLKSMLDDCCAGERPIDELKNVGRGMADLAESIQTLMHDLRLQRQLTAELEVELKQRVANRTNALERQMSSLRAQATRDALTGLHNRRMLTDCLPKMVLECRTENAELSILAIDVDNFKPLNDTLGHAAGDDFLRSIGQILRSGIRECDAAIRCGGDEFIVLLPHCPQSAAQSLADRLTAMVQSLAKTMRTSLVPGLSTGVASMSALDHGMSVEDTSAALLVAADRALYSTKAMRKSRAA